MGNRWVVAHQINQGACNPSGIARALVEACDEAMAEHKDTKAVCEDSAINVIVGQLAFLCGLSLGPDSVAMATVENKYNEWCRQGGERTC